MEEYEIDSIVDEFLDNLRYVVYLKVVKKCRVHWWDGWESEEDSHEGEEDSSKEEENGKLIPFPSIDAAYDIYSQQEEMASWDEFQTYCPHAKGRDDFFEEQRMFIECLCCEVFLPNRGG